MKTLFVLVALSLAALACKVADSSTVGLATSGLHANMGDGSSEMYEQKGLKPGETVFASIRAANDPDRCIALAASPDQRATIIHNAPNLARLTNGSLVDACPTDKVVGTCNARFGMLVNYSSPRWSAATAKHDCLADPIRRWIG
jgi:hypothetical protein